MSDTYLSCAFIILFIILLALELRRCHRSSGDLQKLIEEEIKQKQDIKPHYRILTLVKDE